MKNRNRLILAVAPLALALSAIQSLAQSTYNPYAFTTLAGGGGYSTNLAGSAARFYAPTGVAVDSADNVYVADTYNNTIRKVTTAGVVTTLGGEVGSFGAVDGTETTTRFGNPSAVTVDSEGNPYVADFYFNTIRKGILTSRLSDFGLRDGQFGFNPGGLSGHSVIVEASTDLVNWLPLSTNFYYRTQLYFRDPQTGVVSNRFYRACVP